MCANNPDYVADLVKVLIVQNLQYLTNPKAIKKLEMIFLH